MDKKHAIELLGGTVTDAAKAIGVTTQAISLWPDVLSPKIADRVQAALWRMEQAKKRKARLAAEPTKEAA